jgi:hypothetical protein
VQGPHKALVALGLSITIWVFAVAPRGMFSGDSGVKLAQSHALWTSGFSTRALPTLDVDPTGELTGYGEFKRRVDGEWQGIYSLTFTALTAPLIGAFGLTGMLILPLLGTLLVLAGTYVLARRAGCDPWWAVATSALIAFATPLLFYSSQLTEHTLATGLVTWALVLVVPDRTSASRRDLLAGVLVGFAATVRPECYLAIAAVGIALLVPPWTTWQTVLRRGALFAAGALVIVIPYWLINERLSGTWDPLVTFQKGAAVSWNNIGLLVVGVTRAPVNGIFIAYGLCLLTGALPTSWRRGLRMQVATTTLLAVVVGLSAMVALYSYWRGSTGLFTVTPIAIVGLWAGGRTSAARRAWVGSVVLLIAVLALNRSGDSGGLQFGARLLMPVVPALLCLGCAHLQTHWREQQHRALRWLHLVAVSGLFVLTMIAMVRGMTEATSIARDGERAARLASRAKGSVIVTTMWWESQILAPALLDGKVSLHAADAAQLQRLYEQLADHGITDVTVVDLRPPSIPAAAGSHAVTAGERATTPWGAEGTMYFQEVRIEPARP